MKYVEHLAPWIGLETTFDGKRLRVIEVLEEGPSLVVEVLDAPQEVQEDAYGFFAGFQPKVYIVPVFSSLTPGKWHPVAEAFLALNEGSKH